MSASSAIKKKSSKPKVQASHPPFIDMVKSAIAATKDRKGTSLSSIKKYIAANYKLDVEKHAPHIRRNLVHALDKKIIVRVGTKGKGASGSFKLADKKVAEAKPKTVKKPAPAKPKKAKPAKKPVAKKPVKPKTAKKPAKPKTPKKPKAAVKKTKTPKKAATKKTPKKK